MDCRFNVPVECFDHARELWGNDCHSIPEYAFAIRMENTDIILSNEHTGYQWMDLHSALDTLTFDSNIHALKELHNRLHRIIS